MNRNVKLWFNLALTLAFLSSILSACSSSKYEGGRLDFPSAKVKRSVKASANTNSLPWEIWPIDRDLEGAEIHSAYIRQGDRDLQSGLRLKALENYSRAQSTSLTESEKAALALRIASTQLALDQATQALSTLSKYFRGSGSSPAEVDERFALVFAYAYGRNKDMDQSLAWFAKVANGGSRAIDLRSVAESGIRLILRSVPEDRLSDLPSMWEQETLIRSLIGSERARRAAGGIIDTDRGIDIWGSNSSYVDNAIPSEAIAVPIGVLLPLSGKYGILGRSSKNGIELALEGQKSIEGEADLPPVVRLETRDCGTSPQQSVDEARVLISSSGVKVILGPLLAEHSIAVRELASQTQTPMIALSKNSNFPVGEGAFRLGATVDSQVRSLVEASHTLLGMTRFALVYPIGVGGEEFSEAFRKEVRARNLEIVYEAAYPSGGNDELLKAAKDVESSSAQGIFFPDSLILAARFFGALNPEFRRKIRPLGAGNWDNAVQLSNSSTVLEGAVLVSPFFVQSARPVVQRFVEAYKLKYGSTPDFLAAQGFDALTLVQEIVRKQQVEQSSFNSAVRGLDVYDGLTGRISLREDGEFERLFSVVEMKGGVLHELVEQAPPSYVAYGGEQYQLLEPTVRDRGV